MDLIKKSKNAGILLLLLMALAVTAVKASYKKEMDGTSYVIDTQAAEIGSSRYTQKEKENVKIINTLSLDGFEKKLENETLEIYFHEKLASLRIVDKRSGYIWGFVGTEQPDNLNKQWYAMANSLLTLEYYDEKDADKRISLSSKDAKVTYNWNNNSLEAAVVMEELGISFDFTMNLKEDKLTFSIVEGSVKEEGDIRIKSVYFMPFLGTTQETEIDGYMFVPDGPGALIRYKSALNYSSGFEKKIYGKDMGIDLLTSPSGLMASRSDDYLVEEPQITMPVYGIVHGANQNAVLTVIEKGAEYTSIIANVSGILTNYNWVTARFDYRQSYMQPTSKAGNGIYMPQQIANDITPKISFYFLTGENADYSGMAVKYRSILEEEGILHKERVDEEIPLRLNVVGADIRKGFIRNPLSVFTTVDEAKKMLSELQELGIHNTTMVYEGWQKGGLNGSKYGNFKFENKLGKEKDFLELKETVEKQMGRFYLSINPITANSDQINKVREGNVNLSRSYTAISRSDRNLLYKDFYFIKPSRFLEVMEKEENQLEEFLTAMDQLGIRLYGDYTRKREVTRKEVMELVTKYLESREKVAFYNPNQYLWNDTREYFDMPMVNSQYLYETDTVPFLQMVLKGSMDYYAPYANQGFYSTNSILKMIEYGTYPSFIVGAAPNHTLANTQLMDLFSIHYRDWMDIMDTVYSQVSEALIKVEGTKMAEHKVLSDGVVRVTYENGVKIYVNYNGTSEMADGREIPPRGFSVFE